MMDVVHEMPLLSTLAIGLTAAFVCGMAAAKLRLSPIVGYLLAGILVGPFTPGIETNTDIASELAEIGIVLLMFGVGLHFSVHDLLKVRKIALPGAVGLIVISIAMGSGIAYLWEWPLERGLLMGLALSASTVVLLRALEQHNILYSQNGRIAVGWLIVEDLAMVLALVLIPALAPSVNGAVATAGIWEWLSSLSLALGKITLFILCMLVIGKRVLPWLLRLVAQTRSRELFTLAVFESAIGIAITVRHAYEAQRIMTAVRKLRPDLKVLVRAENYHDFLHFDAQNVSLAVMGKWETARRMAEYIRGEILSNKHIM